jgi:hypothetical protein
MIYKQYEKKRIALYNNNTIFIEYFDNYYSGKAFLSEQIILEIAPARMPILLEVKT